MSEDEAESRVQYVEFQNQYPSFEMSEAKVSKYYEMLEPSGISAEQYWSYLQSLPEDPKKEDILEVIHSMKLTREQKDALYLAEGYAESKLKDAPWN